MSDHKPEIDSGEKGKGSDPESKSAVDSAEVSKLQKQIDSLLSKTVELKAEVDRKETVIQGYQKRHVDLTREMEGLTPVVTEVMTQLSANVDPDVLALLEGKPLAERFTWLKKLSSKSAPDGGKPKQDEASPLRARPAETRDQKIVESAMKEAREMGVNPVDHALAKLKQQSRR